MSLSDKKTRSYCFIPYISIILQFFKYVLIKYSIFIETNSPSYDIIYLSKAYWTSDICLFLFQTFLNLNKGNFFAVTIKEVKQRKAEIFSSLYNNLSQIFWYSLLITVAQATQTELMVP